MFFWKPLFNLWLLQEHIPLFHNLLARGKYTLEGDEIMAIIQNLYAEYECDFRNHNKIFSGVLH
jgi:hypothetical protein